MSGEPTNHRRCAACKYLRRRCAQDCILSPYFPSSDPYKFACVHRVFGASNVAQKLHEIPIELRAHAAEAMATEAQWRVQDPVYGSTGVICQLLQQISAMKQESAWIQSQIAMHQAQAQEQAQAQAQSLNSEHQFSEIGESSFHDFSNHFPNLL